MIRRKKKLVFRKKLAIFKRIKRSKSHHLFESGYYSIKNTIEGSPKIPQKVKDDIAMLFAIIQPTFNEIMYLFEDSED